MPSLTFRSRIEAPAEAVFEWHKRPGAFERLNPPWAPVELKTHEGIRDGDRAVMRVNVGPATRKWIAEHHDYVEGRQFRDVQVKGPFDKWEHTHRVVPDGPDACFLEDAIEFEMPLGKLGDELEGRVMERLERQFAYRHRITRQDVLAHLRYNPGRALRIAISGATGLLGGNLTAFLTAGGHEVIPMVRKPPEKGEKAIYWNHRQGEIEAEKLEGLDAVIHLAGEPVFELRWSDDKKTRIMGSRVRGTGLVAKTLARLDKPPGVFVSASGINYYGHSGQEELTEDAPPGEAGFLCLVSQEWEAAAKPALEAGIRTVNVRTGVVLSPQGGALEMMLPAFRMGFGARVGDKNQYMSWIALDDYIYAMYHVLWTETLNGPINFTAPEPATMDRFTKTLGHVLSRPTFLKAPSGLLKLVSGEAAEEMMLASIRVIPKRLLDSGYTFHYPTLEESLRHELGMVKLTPKSSTD